MVKGKNKRFADFFIKISFFPFSLFPLFPFPFSYTYFSKVSIFCLSRAIIRLRAM
jgi:hypothetical protein